jgi:hypothetical protein
VFSLHGHETWSFALKDERVFENRVLRGISRLGVRGWQGVAENCTLRGLMYLILSLCNQPSAREETEPPDRACDTVLPGQGYGTTQGVVTRD